MISMQQQRPSSSFIYAICSGYTQFAHKMGDAQTEKRALIAILGNEGPDPTTPSHCLIRTSVVRLVQDWML